MDHQVRMCLNLLVICPIKLTGPKQADQEYSKMNKFFLEFRTALARNAYK